MGFLSLLAPCAGCGRLFTSNPYRVPVAVVDGVRRPICRTCLGFANDARVERGLDPLPILPGAYDPAPETIDVDDLSELGVLDQDDQE